MFDKIDKYKTQIDALRLWEGSIFERIKAYYRIMLTYSSNALEGGALSEPEMKILLEDGLQTGDKSRWDYFEAIGHARAFDYIYTIGTGEAISEEHIKTMHRLFYSQVDAEIGAEQAGVYREERIKIAGSNYATPTPDKIAPLMSCFADWLAQKEHELHPVEFAARAHKELVFIYPFIDGNRRVARLLMNLCLMRKGYTMTVIPPALRSEYTALLEKAHEDEQPFVDFIAERVAESQRDLIRLFA